MTETKLTWHHPLCEGECFACLIERTIKKEYGEVGLRYLLKQINDAPVQQAEQEPVAWRNKDTGSFCTGGFLCKDIDKWTPLYAAPVRTKDLADDEIRDIATVMNVHIHYKELCLMRAAIAADREKNK